MDTLFLLIDSEDGVVRDHNMSTWSKAREWNKALRAKNDTCRWSSVLPPEKFDLAQFDKDEDAREAKEQEETNVE